ncbi:MAG: hypothetical protein P4L67_04700 [Candidatus Pacebacteria bacterium]|nr:hypothetical protein [Candidatus Paceibacterota bacterium]
MIDLKTIKTGDRVVFHVPEGSHCYVIEDGVGREIKDGDIFVVANPPVGEYEWYVRVACDFFPGGFFCSVPDHCSLVGDA